ncbi:hypothetical protein BCU99_08340 [Vibrio cyclitrophicus]|uniref:hypothetical protein n=1 Tax=Vibrio cyclitrophicus TaxID=47951 RepID=UPI000C8207C9|nr:hypothetical protein [Vibrio cyclitrophicus]PMG11474.1 hypothetical protein BCU99_17370 [Vibrio cyclitrophicus]
MSNTNELDFTTILHGYYSNDEQYKRWQETCAALTLVKHTLNCESANTLSALDGRIEKVADGIRKSLERE